MSLPLDSSLPWILALCNLALYDLWTLGSHQHKYDWLLTVDLSVATFIKKFATCDEPELQNYVDSWFFLSMLQCLVFLLVFFPFVLALVVLHVSDLLTWIKSILGLKAWNENLFFCQTEMLFFLKSRLFVLMCNKSKSNQINRWLVW